MSNPWPTKAEFEAWREEVRFSGAACRAVVVEIRKLKTEGEKP